VSILLCVRSVGSNSKHVFEFRKRKGKPVNKCVYVLIHVDVNISLGYGLSAVQLVNMLHYFILGGPHVKKTAS
jgi:hypothetical protein